LKTLLTGSEGYVCSNLKKLIPESYKYDVKTSSELWLLGIDKLDLIYHLGAIAGIQVCEDYPDDAIKYNIISTRKMCQLAEKHGAKIVFASSEAAVNPLTFYGQTKRIGESLVRKVGGMVCRISNVYGGDNYLEKKDSVIAKLMKGTFEERGMDYERRDFIHVDEVCRGLIEASTKPSGVYSLNTGVRTYIKDLKVKSKDPDFPNMLRSPYKLTKIE
jgi:nucleoside-diphosphate-sugar epimerase